MRSHEVDELTRATAGRRLTIAWSVVAAVSFAWFLYDGVARVWSVTATDFPNYYAASKSILIRSPLQVLYDYPEFQREISRAGIDHQLGGYIPQTPLTMLPFMPLSPLNPLNAKRTWLVVNLGFIGLTLWLLSRMTRFNVPQLWMVVIIGYPTFRQNFWLGQYYVFLLALLATAAYALLRSLERPAGTTLAAVVALKLYGAPFLLFLAAKRRFRATTAFLSAVLLLIALEIGLFGWSGTVFYATQVLPRSLTGETLNPYHPAASTFVTLLRGLLIYEPGLNPHPPVNSPVTFAFLQCAFTLSVLLVPALAAWNRLGPVTKMDLAWWSITLLLVSPNTASYTFLLLTLPVVLLLDEVPGRKWPYILIPWFLLGQPIPPAWIHLFPRAWLLLFLFIVVGLHYFNSIDRRAAGFAIAGILAVSAGAAVLVAEFPETPPESAIPIAVQPDAIYSGSPVVTAAGVFYESIAPGRYVIMRWDGVGFETFRGDGDIFHPSAPDSAGKLYVERFSGGHSSIAFFDFPNHQSGMATIGQPDPSEPAISHDGRTLAFVSKGGLFISDGQSDRRLGSSATAHEPAFVRGDKELVYVEASVYQSKITRIDLATDRRTTLVERVTDLARPSISPDGHMLAFASRQTGNWQVWTRNLITGHETQLTNGRCNSMSPAWSLDSREIVFGSDCRRGLNLPALFRMPIGAPDLLR